MQLPKRWPRHVRSAIVHALSMANVSLTAIQARAENHFNARTRLQGTNDRLQRQVALLQEELRIKDARMERLPAQRRPHYPAIERLAILELRAARGWSQAATARRLLVTPLTVASWTQRLDDEGPDALVQVGEPVNRFPELVSYLVRRLRALCPKMRTRRIARTLARAGLHLGATTARRMLKPAPKPAPKSGRSSKSRAVTAKSPNHVWHLDLTTVPARQATYTSNPKQVSGDRGTAAFSHPAVALRHYAKLTVATLRFFARLRRWSLSRSIS